MYQYKLVNEATQLRQAGYSLKEISQILNIAKSTASIWLKDVEISLEGQDRIKDLIKQNGAKLQSFSTLRSKTATAIRERDFLNGYESEITYLDALVVGLYWGEGDKYKKIWGISNSNREIISTMIKWAISAGQDIGQFRASVILHPEDEYTDDYIKDYWSIIGIPRERILIYRIRTPTSNKRALNKLACGTCHLFSIRNGARLFEILDGKKKKLMELF